MKWIKTLCVLYALFVFGLGAYAQNNTETQEEGSIMCTMEYAPVCGKKDSIQKTYGNKCMMNAEKATYISMGECEIEKIETPAVCTKEYAPVCGKKDGIQKTYGNKCMMNAEKASYVSMGECTAVKEENPKNTDTKIYKGNTKTCQLIKFACDEGTQYFSDTKGCGCEKVLISKVPEALKVKMKKVIDNFIVKLEAQGYSNEKKLATIEQTIEKLQTLAKKNEKYKNLSLYAIELLTQHKEKYQDDFSEFEKIFSEGE